MPALGTRALEAGLVVCWSSGFIGGVLAAEAGAIFSVLFWRFAVATLLLAPVAALSLRHWPVRAIARQALVGALAVFGYLACLIAAIDLGVDPATAAIVTALQPLATAALAGPLLGERVGLAQAAGLGLGLAGVVLAVGALPAPAPALSYALAFLAMASIVAGSLAAKSAPAGALGPTLFVHVVTSAVLFAPLAALEGTLAPRFDAAFLAAVAWFVVLSTLGGYGFYFACLARGTATRTASLMYLTPPVTALWAWAMFGAPIEAASVAGFAVCLAGVTLAARPAVALKG